MNGLRGMLEAVVLFSISHLLLIGFAYMIFLGLTMAIANSLWNTVETAPYARPVTPPVKPIQPPSLPK